MKSLMLAVCLAVAIVMAPAGSGLAQSSVNMANTSNTRFHTNSVALGGASGIANRTNGPFHFEVLTAPSNVTSVDFSLQNILSSSWSDTGLQGTNSALSGRENAGTNVNVNFWPIGRTNSFIVVGWTVNLGETWVDVAAKLFGVSLVSQNGGYVWQGGGLQSSDGSPAFLGATTVGFRQGGGDLGDGEYIPIPLLFGVSPDSQGNPIMTTTELWIVAPEPSVFALAGMAVAGWAIVARKTWGRG